MRTDRTQFAPETLGKIQGYAGQRAEPDAWRKLIGDKPVSARIELLPETRIRFAAWFTSVLFQTALAVLLVAIPLIFPSKLGTLLSYEVTPVASVETQVVLPGSQRTPPRPESRPAPPPTVRPEPIRVPRQLVFAPTVPRPSMPIRIQDPQAPRIEASPEALMLEASSEPARPREPVKTGVISGSSNAPTVEPSTEIAKVQTGEFGDIGGVPGVSSRDSRANAVRLGSLNVAATGSGETSGAASTVHGGVAGSGFASAAAISATGPNQARVEVKPGGFASVTNSPETVRPKQDADVPTVESVVILEKPSPMYTEEARRLGIEGEVQIHVVFLASGAVQVVGVSKGLGHGLDEAATRAALKIRFKPARREGQAVDFPATVRIAFQLAF